MFFVGVLGRMSNLARDMSFSGNLSVCLHAYFMYRKRNTVAYRACAVLGRSSRRMFLVKFCDV